MARGLDYEESISKDAGRRARVPNKERIQVYTSGMMRWLLLFMIALTLASGCRNTQRASADASASPFASSAQAGDPKYGKPSATAHLKPENIKLRAEALNLLDLTASKDYKRAIELYMQAGADGDALAQMQAVVNTLQYLDNDDLLSSPFVANETAPLVKKLADGGDAEAQYLYAVWLEQRPGALRSDDEQALNYMQLAAQQQSRQALRWLALCYRDGTLVDKNLDQAVRLFQEAAAQGDSGSHYAAAMILMDEQYQYHDYPHAFEECRAARDAGYIPAFHALGYCYEEGVGTAVDLKAAFDCHKSGSRLDSMDCWYALGRCYELALGTGYDPGAARKAYEQAARLGDKEAQAALVNLNGGLKNRADQESSRL